MYKNQHVKASAYYVVVIQKIVKMHSIKQKKQTRPGGGVFSAVHLIFL